MTNKCLWPGQPQCSLWVAAWAEGCAAQNEYKHFLSEPFLHLLMKALKRLSGWLLTLTSLEERLCPLGFCRNAPVLVHTDHLVIWRRLPPIHVQNLSAPRVSY